MNKIKFRLFISVIVFIVAVALPLSLEAVVLFWLPNDQLSEWERRARWEVERSDYESSGLYASKPVIMQTPFNDLKMHGERVVTDGNLIVTEKWVPYKPEGYHYISISIKATGYGEVAFELKGETRDFSIGHWTSEPIQKAINELYQFRIKEPNNVINSSIRSDRVGHIQPTKVKVTATGKALTRSRRVTTYGSKQEAVTAQASLTGVSAGVVIGTSSYWKWEAGITRPVPVKPPYEGSYSIEISDTAWSQIYYNTIFTAGDRSTFVSGETVTLHLKTKDNFLNVNWYKRSPYDIRSGNSATYIGTDEYGSSISNRGYTYTNFTCPSPTGTYEIIAAIHNQDGTIDHVSFYIEVES